MSRLQVDGLAMIPFDGQQRPDFANAVCAPSLLPPQVKFAPTMP